MSTGSMKSVAEGMAELVPIHPLEFAVYAARVWRMGNDRQYGYLDALPQFLDVRLVGDGCWRRRRIDYQARDGQAAAASHFQRHEGVIERAERAAGDQYQGHPHAGSQ